MAREPVGFLDTNEPLPNRFAYIMARGCRNLGRHAFLCGGEPFCHQTDPYQTLRAETWWSQLLVRFRVFFSQNPEITKMRSKISGTCYSCKKKALPGMHHTEVRSGDGHQNPNIQISRHADIQISRYPDIQMSRCPDVRISRYQVSDTRYQVSGIRKNMWKSSKIGFSKKSKKRTSNE